MASCSDSIHSKHRENMKYIIVIDGIKSTKYTYNVWSTIIFEDGAVAQDTRIFESDKEEDFINFISDLPKE